MQQIKKLIIAALVLLQIAIFPIASRQKLVGGLLVGGLIFVTFLSNFLIYKSGALAVKNKIDSCETSIDQYKSIAKDLKKFKRQLNSDDNTVTKEDFIKNMETFFINHEDSVKVNLEPCREKVHKVQICYTYDSERNAEYEYEIIDEKEEPFNQYMDLSNKISRCANGRISTLKQEKKFLQDNKTEYSWMGVDGEKIGLLFLSNFILISSTFSLLCVEENEFQ